MDNTEAMMGRGGGNLAAAMANWHQQYGQDPQNAPVEQSANLFHQWAQQQAPEQVNAMAAEALGHLPQQQQRQVADALVNLFQENGLSLHAAGVQTSDPQTMGMADVAKMVGYVQQNQPNLLQKLLSNRLIRMVILAILAYEANKLMRGFASGGSDQTPSTPAPPPAQPHEGFGDHIRNFLSGLFGGGQDQPPDTTTPPPYTSQPPETSQPLHLGGGVTSDIPPQTISGIQSGLRGASDVHGGGTHHGRQLNDDDPTT